MRIVAKIGTASITDEAGVIDIAAIAKLCDEVAVLRADGHQVIVVSSGAVAAGVVAVGLVSRPTDMATLQAISAAGQSRLVEAYNVQLGRHGLVGAQVLVDPHDFVDRTQYLHARQTVIRLLELGCVPVVNENDAIANHELRYGDNDRLAALVANSVSADLLVLLTDTDGVYTHDPRRDPNARLVTHVASDDPLLAISADRGGSGRGSGGMASKLVAAKIASWSGIRSVIARAASPDVLVKAVAGDHGRDHVRRPRPHASGTQTVDCVRRRGRGCDRGRCRRRTGPHHRTAEPAARWCRRRPWWIRRWRHRRGGRTIRSGVRPWDGGCRR